MKNIYLIMTDEEVSSVRDLKKLESTEFATITDLDTGVGWETFNATLPQKREVLPFVEACSNALRDEGLLEDTWK